MQLLQLQKHHEGFNLFDSKFTDYKSTNTPYGKDILREWVEAFKVRGIKNWVLLLSFRLASPTLHS